MALAWNEIKDRALAFSKEWAKAESEVNAAYGKKSFASEAERVAFLFIRYQHLTSLLPTTKKIACKSPKPT